MFVYSKINVYCVWFIAVLALSTRVSAFVLPSKSSSSTTATSLFGVLSRSAILRAVNRQRNQPTNKRDSSTFEQQPQPLTKWFLAGAIQEAQHRQQHILDALERESQSSTVVTIDDHSNPDVDDDAIAQEALQQKAERRKRVINERRMEIQSCLSRLLQLENELLKTNTSNLDATKEALVTMGFQKLLADPDSWKWNTAHDSRNGSPADFGGLVYTTPRGVPILVGTQSAHGDSTLRRISQGADMWFQVSDYHGSRVLLRTSLAKGLKDSKECRIMAANLAAYYSDYRTMTTNDGDDDVVVSVMYTDSKHVAKRGSKAGQMRKKKAFGEMGGRP
eukprot:CAMPEP_0119017334 /NCGR_PEP_ID=MMETSP1176-20130426/16249_1 /TAXON_ID=265551 /ORGANISM="Synedropsis recta cf, Strain CCMP1620" /LENGTH=333 /DNA_ID=CAMNT_0006971029 /DNA_START=81 /DNA_END=1079 /DNA_ORIENTATION=-